MRFRPLWPLVSLVLVLSCSGKEEPSEPSCPEIRIDVAFDDFSVKTSYSEVGGALKCSWVKGDRISLVSLVNGAVATIDELVTDGDGASAQFHGSYTGRDGSRMICVYPPVGSGPFIIRSGISYLTLSASYELIQHSDADPSHLAETDLMLGEVNGGAAALARKSTVMKLVLSVPELSPEEKAVSAELCIPGLNPFAVHNGSISLSGGADRWTSADPSGVAGVKLGGFALPGKTLTAYVPVFPLTSTGTLQEDGRRAFDLTFTTDKCVYKASCSIPTTSGESGYAVDPGCQYTIEATLTASSSPVDPVAFGEEKCFLACNKADALWIEGNTLFMGDEGNIYIYDVSDPWNPKFISSARLWGMARQMKAYNGRLYVTARETGTWIYDISDLSNPRLLSRFDTVEVATGLDVVGDAMFVGQRQNGVEFVDVTDPVHPEHVNLFYTSESQSVFYKDGYLYSGEWGAGRITIFDCRDFSNIRQLRTIDLQGYGDGLWITGNRLYASTGHNHKNSAKKTMDGDGHGMEIWDITDRENPVFISRVEFDIFYKSGTDYWFPRPTGDGRTVFCSDVFNGAYAVDITDETRPKILARYQTPNQKAITSIAVGRGVVYFSAGSDGFRVVRSSLAVPCTRQDGDAPANVSFRRNYQTPSSSRFNSWKPGRRGQVRGAAVYGDAVFVACGDAGLYILKQKADGTLYQYADCFPSFAGDVKVKGDRLYVAEGHAGFGVYSISAGPSISLIRKETAIGSVAGSQCCFWIAVPNDRYVVAGSRYRGFHYMLESGSGNALSYTAKLQNSVNVNYNKYISDLVCSGDKLPYATRSGLVWIELGGTGARAGSTITDIVASWKGGITNYKDGKALMPASNKLHIIASGGSSFEKDTPSNTLFEGCPRWDGGDRILLTNTHDQIATVVNLADFGNPVVELSENTDGRPESGTFWNGKAVVPCGYQGLLVQK